MDFKMEPITPDIAKCWDDPCHETLRRLSYYLAYFITPYIAAGKTWLIVLTIWSILSPIILGVIQCCMWVGSTPKRQKAYQNVQADQT